MLAGNGEVPAPVVCLEASLAVSPLRQCGSHEDVNALPRGAYLGVGVELLDYLLSPALYLACLGIQAAVQVHAAERVVLAEHDSYATVTVLSVRLYGFA